MLKFSITLGALALALALSSGCKKKAETSEAPAEAAGAEADQATEPAGETVEEAGDKVEEKTE
jgi:TRAP-type C4-dicarboxylate transport system substrate-binding protein